MEFYTDRNGVEWSLHFHENNPGHWLHNTELWAAAAHLESPVSRNGYAKPPFFVVAREYCQISILNSEMFSESEKQPIRGWLEAKLNSLRRDDAAHLTTE